MGSHTFSEEELITIECTIFGNKNASTIIGTGSGKSTPLLEKLNTVFAKSGFNPRIVNNIIQWLCTHYAEAVGFVAGVMKAGNGEVYVNNKTNLNDTVKLIREGFRVCHKYGINSLTVYPQCMYWLPLPIISYALRKMLSTEASQKMIKGHISHSPDKMKYMFFEILKSGQEKKVWMKHFQEFQDTMRYTNTQK